MSSPPCFDPLRLDDRGAVSDPSRFPAGRNPYYIVTPRYVRTSAGIKALHLLCHCLNRVGQEAYVLIYPRWSNDDATNPAFLTPIVTPDVNARHLRDGLSPIVVYPETVYGNPIRARTVVRYVLNFPGHLAGDSSYADDEIVYGYSTVLAQAAGAPGQVLFIPASDTAIFTPDPPRERSGSCFWAMKYRLVHGAEPFTITDDSEEITREQPNSQDPAQIAELFRVSELFYTYENTALALEAALCLCPTVFLPNPWLTEAIAIEEMGMDGFAWGADPAEIARAKATVHLARKRYLANYLHFWDQLSGFITVTQMRAEADALRLGPPTGMLWRLRWQPRIETFVFLIRRAVDTFRREGLVAVGLKTRRKIIRIAGTLSRRRET